MRFPDIFIDYYNNAFKTEASFHVFQSYEFTINASEYEHLVNLLTEKSSKVFFEELHKGESVAKALKRARRLFKKEE